MILFKKLYLFYKETIIHNSNNIKNMKIYKIINFPNYLNYFRKIINK